MSFNLQEGIIFAGRYQVLGCIAAGGMGAVYEVLHLETDRRRALKVMLPQMLQSAELRDRFKREAKVAAKVESEFIVEVFDAGVDAATQMPFMVMELLKGEELGKRLKRQGRFSPVEVLTYLKQVAMALDKTHMASIVHRDLKPDNLFLTLRDDGQPRIKVLDFGVAKVIAESVTVAGGTRSLGTPIYMSPEQFDPEARLTGAADIYALGMIAYTLLVGAPYWHHESRKSGNVVIFAMTAVHGPPQPASVRAAPHGVKLPPAFDAWFARMTARDPAYRFPTATGAVAALAEAIGLPSSGFQPSMLDVQARASSASSPSPAVTGVRSSPSSVAGIDVGSRGRRAPALILVILAVAAVIAGAAGILFVRASHEGPIKPAPTEEAQSTVARPPTSSGEPAGLQPDAAVNAPAAPTSPARSPEPTRQKMPHPPSARATARSEVPAPPSRRMIDPSEIQ